MLRGRMIAAAVAVAISFLSCFAAAASPFHDYVLTGRIVLPAGAGPFDVLSDGRIVTLVAEDVYVQSAAGADTFTFHGTLPDADLPSFGAAFLRVSPDGTLLAVGNNGGGSFESAVRRAVDGPLPDAGRARFAAGSLQILVRRQWDASGESAAGADALSGAGNFAVGVFDFGTLSGTWFSAGHFDAAWIDGRHLAITAGDFPNPSRVTALDTISSDPLDPINPVLVGNVGGASGGIAFDAAGNLYTANGFITTGPSDTGTVKAFSPDAWQAAMSGGPALDFEKEGTVIVDVLSAASLDFDRHGSLIVGGGDFFGDGETDFAAVVRAFAVARALSGGPHADPNDARDVRRLDPDTANPSNFYTVNVSAISGELSLQDGPLHVYAPAGSIPAVSAWGLALTALVIVALGGWAVRARLAVRPGRPCAMPDAECHNTGTDRR